MDPAAPPVEAPHPREPADTLTAAFRPGDIDLRLNVETAGYSLSPTSLVLAFAGWQSIGMSFDAASAEAFSDLTLGFGAEAWYARPLVASALFEGEVDSEDPDVTADAEVWTAGITGRGTLHLRRAGIEENLPSSIDPYVVGLFGPTFGGYHVAFETPEGRLREGSADFGWRIGAGGGANFVDPKSGWLGAVELRYLVGFNVIAEDRVVVEEQDGAIDSYDRIKQERPPKGFSWVIGIGRRF